MLSTLENLIKLARDRKLVPQEGSYTNKLLTDKALSKAKVLEEVDELIEAIEDDNDDSYNKRKSKFKSKYKQETNDQNEIKKAL